jgi:hypothetical protein
MPASPAELRHLGRMLIFWRTVAAVFLLLAFLAPLMLFFCEPFIVFFFAMLSYGCHLLAQRKREITRHSLEYNFDAPD